MDLKAIERVVGSLQSHIFKRSNAHASGVLKSHFRGSGLQFREHQIYVPGDDVRFIDWKLSARSQNTYVKTFEEDRNVEIVVFLDLSHTLLYGFEGISKLQATIEIIALLFLLAAETHDQIRVIIWCNKTINLPPKKGREGLTLFISVLEKLGLMNKDGKVVLEQPKDLNTQDEEAKIGQIKAFLARRKEVVYLGDMSLVKDKEKWGRIIDKKSMHCFRIYSPVDKNNGMPFLFKARDPQSGKAMITDLRGLTKEGPLFKKERFKEIGVHERYLEKFIKELA
jgi:uncharacterized protein (DUF58 family)